jgi:hypothetical protein
MHVIHTHKIAAKLVAVLLVAGAAGAAIATADAAVPGNLGALKVTTITTRPVASAAQAGCWRGITHTVTLTSRTTGQQLFRLRIIQHGWCGNGYRITRDYGWKGQFALAPGYCLANAHYTAGWKYYPTQRHGKSYGTLGYVDAYGQCVPVRYVQAGLTIRGDGRYRLGY